MNDTKDARRAVTDEQLEQAIRGSLAERDESSSSCPSEIARTLAPEPGEVWRELMPRVRHVLARLVREEQVSVTRGSAVLSPENFDGGPIRIRRGKRFGQAPPTAS